VGLAVIVPIAYLVVRATEQGWSVVVETVWRVRTAELVGRSIVLAVTVMALSLVVGVGAAWLVSRTDLPGRQLWRVVLALPLAMPSYVAAWAWIGFRPGLAGFGGAVLVLTTISYPYVYIPVLSALSGADPALEEVARSLGRSRAEVFVTVTLRQIRIAAIGGALLVGLYTVSEFGAVSIMRYETLTKAIYASYRSSFDRTPAAILGCVLVVVTLLPLAMAVRTSSRATVARVGGGSARRMVPVRLGAWRVPAVLGVVAVVGASLGVPAWNLVRWSERGRSTIDWGELVGAAWSTFGVAAAAAAITVAVAIPLGILSARHPGRLADSITTVAYAGHALPGVVVALSLVFFGIRFAAPAYQETPLLVFAYLVLFLTLAIGAVHHSVARVSPVLDDVARSLGRTQAGAWRSVTLRLALPGIGSAAALVFIAAAKELPATLLLRPIGMDTLATRLWSHTDAASYAAAAPYAVALVLVSAVPTAVLTAARLDR
jgi:iron(III) transport system permease protein